MIFGLNISAAVVTQVLVFASIYQGTIWVQFLDPQSVLLRPWGVEDLLNSKGLPGTYQTTLGLELWTVWKKSTAQPRAVLSLEIAETLGGDVNKPGNCVGSCSKRCEGRR